MLFINNFASTLTSFTMTLSLCVHSRPHLHNTHYNTLSLTPRAYIHFIPSFSIASSTKNLSIDLYFYHLPVICFFKCYLYLFNSGFKLGFFACASLSTSSPKENIKNISKTTALHTLVFQPFKSILVIEFTFLRI